MMISRKFDEANKKRRETYYKSCLNKADTLNFGIIAFLQEIHEDSNLSDKKKQRIRKQVLNNFIV